MPQLINWSLIREPYNWLITIAIVTFAMFAVSIIANNGRLPE